MSALSRARLTAAGAFYFQNQTEGANMSATHASPIIRKLRNALNWLSADGRDWDTKHDIIIICEHLLDQSFTDYSGWWARRSDDVAALKPKAIAALVELAISDVDCAPNVYEPHPLLERFASGELVIKAKRARTPTRAKCVAVSFRRIENASFVVMRASAGIAARPVWEAISAKR